MRWFKKIVRAVLALLPLFAIFLLPSNCYALQHNYGGFVTGDILIPGSDLSSNSFERWSNSLSLEFKGNAWFDYYSRLSPAINTWHISNSAIFTLSNNTCVGSMSHNNPFIFASDFDSTSVSSSKYVAIQNRPFVPDNFNVTGNASCYKYGDSRSYSLDIAEYGLRFNSYDGSQLSSTDALTTLSTFYPPRPWSAEGLKLEANSQSGGGILYSHSFSFTKYFGMGIPRFSSLSIPLFSKDGYFLDSNNLWQGRHFDFTFMFRFYDGFSWNPDLSNGSIHVVFGLARDNNNVDRSGDFFDCTANNQVVEDYNLLNITCSGDLAHTYKYAIPKLVIENNDNYVWDSPGEWEFYSAYIVSDYDNTPGGSFNNNFIGDMWSPSSDDSDGATANWFGSLTNLFNFSIPISDTPLGSIFGGFTDSMSCASIPTIASMIHSNETSVCPWFNSTIRSITTPILSLAAVMLTFGFIVRWLGSSSGNNFNDSGGI